LRGYAGGVDKKQFLLELEGIKIKWDFALSKQNEPT
jgi:hypothetical protein